jgi:hypothetical protein
MTLVERSSRFLDRHLSRRSFLVRGTFAASALALAPKRYVLEPGTAYEAFCGESQCGSSNCSCGSTCCEGFSTFCCTVNGGYNYCPDGSIVGGWWAAADSSFCGNGTRYYIDCNGTCHCDSGCGGYYSNGGTFCDSGCDGLDCHCEGDNCNNWVESCFQFRYGQCNTDVACTGRIICRIVSCVEPWKLDFDCGSSYMWDSGTAEMNAPCNTSVPRPPPPPCDSPSTNCETVAIASPPRGGGYWLATSYGKVIAFGAATAHGDMSGKTLGGPIVAIESSYTGAGYYLAGANGSVFNFGDARFEGSPVHRDLPAPITAMACTPTGKGYWLAGANGSVYNYGDAPFHGSLARTGSPSPISGIAGTATGAGYWLLDEAGRIHPFGDAVSYGSPAARRPAYPVIAISRTHKGAGYLLLGERGAIWAYGDAVDEGSPYGQLGRWDSVGLARSGGKGYWVTTADGAIYSYGGAVDHGAAN